MRVLTTFTQTERKCKHSVEWRRTESTLVWKCGACCPGCEIEETQGRHPAFLQNRPEHERSPTWLSWGFCNRCKPPFPPPQSPATLAPDFRLPALSHERQMSAVHETCSLWYSVIQQMTRAGKARKLLVWPMCSDFGAQRGREGGARGAQKTPRAADIQKDK